MHEGGDLRALDAQISVVDVDLHLGDHAPMIFDLLVEDVMQLLEHVLADAAIVGLPVGQVRRFLEDAFDLQVLPVGLTVRHANEHGGERGREQQHGDEGDPEVAAAVHPASLHRGRAAPRIRPGAVANTMAVFG